jgi:hypothetical protein
MKNKDLEGGNRALFRGTEAAFALERNSLV